MESEQDQRLSLLLSKGQQGDKIAYEHFLKEVSVVLRAFLSARIGSRGSWEARGDQEDVLQDSLVAIHRARHTYTPGRPVKPWIFAICENRLIDNIRKQRRVEQFEVGWIKDLENHFAEEIQESHHQAEIIFEIIKQLPPQQREILELLKMKGYSVADISAKTGMSESAVKVSAFRGYEVIRKGLGIKK